MSVRPSIPDTLRQLVASRTDYLCEYCLIAEADTFVGCQVDHIISLKHDGETTAANLAYACAFCNRQKGTDLGSIDRQTGVLTRFFLALINGLSTLVGSLLLFSPRLRLGG
jgi:5-methylcytosine-specific restriction endonuclease McrA